MADVYAALADPVRRSLVEVLAGAGEASAGQLAAVAADRFGITQPTASKHLKVLRDAGVVSRTVDAQRRIYRLEPRRLREVADWAEHQARYWNDKLDALEAHLHDPEDRP